MENGKNRGIGTPKPLNWELAIKKFGMGDYVRNIFIYLFIFSSSREMLPSFHLWINVWLAWVGDRKVV